MGKMSQVGLKTPVGLRTPSPPNAPRVCKNIVITTHLIQNLYILSLFSNQVKNKSMQRCYFLRAVQYCKICGLLIRKSRAKVWRVQPQIHELAGKHNNKTID